MVIPCFLLAILSNVNAISTGINITIETVAPIGMLNCPTTCLYMSVASTL